MNSGCYKGGVKTSLEGLLIYKIPYQERHLIGHLLSRNGRLASVIFYGGMGGGKKKKSSSLELGHLLQVELSRSRPTMELYRAKEWKPLWVHKNIRHNYQTFSLMCFYLEAMRKTCPAENLHDEHLQSVNIHEGGFRLLSNALFHLEKSASPDIRGKLFVFLAKLLIEQGLFPQRAYCALCEKELASCPELSLMFEHGSFVCFDCLPEQLGDGASGRELWELLGVVAQHKYGDLEGLNLVHIETLHTLFSYFCFQLHFGRRDFKSVSALL